MCLDPLLSRDANITPSDLWIDKIQFVLLLYFVLWCHERLLKVMSTGSFNGDVFSLWPGKSWSRFVSSCTGMRCRKQSDKLGPQVGFIAEFDSGVNNNKETEEKTNPLGFQNKLKKYPGPKNTSPLPAPLQDITIRASIQVISRPFLFPFGESKDHFLNGNVAQNGIKKKLCCVPFFSMMPSKRKLVILSESEGTKWRSQLNLFRDL